MDGVRCNGPKLEHRKFHAKTRKNFFTVSINRALKHAPREVVESLSPEICQVLHWSTHCQLNSLNSLLQQSFGSIMLLHMVILPSDLLGKWKCFFFLLLPIFIQNLNEIWEEFMLQVPWLYVASTSTDRITVPANSSQTEEHCLLFVSSHTAAGRSMRIAKTLAHSEWWKQGLKSNCHLSEKPKTLICIV